MLYNCVQSRKIACFRKPHRIGDWTLDVGLGVGLGVMRVTGGRKVGRAVGATKREVGVGVGTGVNRVTGGR